MRILNTLYVLALLHECFTETNLLKAETRYTIGVSDTCAMTRNPNSRSQCYVTKTNMKDNICCYIQGNGISKCQPIHINNQYMKLYRSPLDGKLYNQFCNSAVVVYHYLLVLFLVLVIS